MKVGVLGLWHLGCVTAACVAELGNLVVGVDENETVVKSLLKSKAPLFELGLNELIDNNIKNNQLTFDAGNSSLKDSEIVIVSYDTPVDENDVPDVSYVEGRIREIFPIVRKNCIILISSQLPVGTTRKLIADADKVGRSDISFAYSPENLRLGSAIEVFMSPDRIVVGIEKEEDKQKIIKLYGRLSNKILWMSIESAEMTKHAINGFLALSVVFMNELSSICEIVGAQAKEVERGLKTERRIGERAYLSPGGPFAGGTLARDVVTLIELANNLGTNSSIIPAIRISNNSHKFWTFNKLKSYFRELKDKKIGILGLTYKPGTNTLRRSSAVELSLQLAESGAEVVVYDPAIFSLPEELSGSLILGKIPEDIFLGSDAVILSTQWPEFQYLDWPVLLAKMKQKIVIDANGFLAELLCAEPGYTAVGRPTILSMGELR